MNMFDKRSVSQERSTRARRLRHMEFTMFTNDANKSSANLIPSDYQVSSGFDLNDDIGSIYDNEDELLNPPSTTDVFEWERVSVEYSGFSYNISYNDKLGKVVPGWERVSADSNDGDHDGSSLVETNSVDTSLPQNQPTNRSTNGILASECYSTIAIEGLLELNSENNNRSFSMDHLNNKCKSFFHSAAEVCDDSPQCNEQNDFLFQDDNNENSSKSVDELSDEIEAYPNNTDRSIIVCITSPLSNKTTTINIMSPKNKGGKKRSNHPEEVLGCVKSQRINQVTSRKNDEGVEKISKTLNVNKLSLDCNNESLDKHFERANTVVQTTADLSTDISSLSCLQSLGLVENEKNNADFQYTSGNIRAKRSRRDRMENVVRQYLIMLSRQDESDETESTSITGISSAVSSCENQANLSVSGCSTEVELT